MKNVEYLIIGAGPTGLGAATYLDSTGAEWHLLERESYFGGLAASFVDGAGFTWDLGGHVQFSHYDEFDRWMDRALGADGWFIHPRESWIWFQGKRIPFPLQNNLHRLDPKSRWACVQGFIEAAASRENVLQLNNYDDWSSSKFGQPFNELFMRPYVAKVWGYPSSELGFQWVDERVSVPTLEQILKSICLNEDSTSWGPNRIFRYPKRGGMGAVWNGIGKLLPAERISLSTPLLSLDREAKIAYSTNDSWRYNQLISSIPLNQLAQMTTGLFDSNAIASLRYSSTIIVGIGLQGKTPPNLETTTWMYFPEPNSPYYRVTVFSNYSPYHVPQPGEQWSLLAEVTETSAKPINIATVVEEVVTALQSDGLISDPERIVSKTVLKSTYGYPTPFIGRDRIVDSMLERLKENGILSRGRFGAWKYEVSNQDHTFMQGVEAAAFLLHGFPEQTLFFPRKINGGAKNRFPYPEWSVTAGNQSA